jgi:hypothetical protein
LRGGERFGVFDLDLFGTSAGDLFFASFVTCGFSFCDTITSLAKVTLFAVSILGGGLAVFLGEKGVSDSMPNDKKQSGSNFKYNIFSIMPPKTYRMQ